ncbi:hypothetical protein [Streptomyces sp. NPDC021212]|uniref:hypothetical protein n=1 Tax=Streptomyces sp. NPDC021212 TaxID=3365118 RepID=UPI0037AC8D74
MRHLRRVATCGALAASALLALTACSSNGSGDAPSAAGKDGKNGTSSSGSPSAAGRPSRSAAADKAGGGSGPAQAVKSKAEVSIKSCQLRDASKLFAIVQLNNVNGAADYAYTVKVRFLNSAHSDQAVYTTLAQVPVQVGAMKSALASTTWKGDSAAMPKTCEVAKATKVKMGG